jgi:hypothetical protein
VAIAVEWKLGNLPAGNVSGQFPATIRARGEVVAFKQPSSIAAGPFSFTYAPPTEAERVVLDAYFDSARLSDQTVQTFKGFQVSAPTATDTITYVTTRSEAACATKLKVEPVVGEFASVEFSQDDSAITSGYRALSILVRGTAAEVTLTSQGTFLNGKSSCAVDLNVGPWKQSAQGFLPIKVQVPAGTSFRLRWQNLDEKSNTWKIKSSAQFLLAFGSTASDGFLAETIAIRSVNPKTGALNPARLEAHGIKASPLTVQPFGINQNQLEIGASGKGRVFVNGNVVTINVLETINKYPIPAALLAGANLALIGWVGRVLFPRRSTNQTTLTN